MKNKIIENIKLLLITFVLLFAMPIAFADIDSTSDNLTIINTSVGVLIVDNNTPIIESEYELDEVEYIQKNKNTTTFEDEVENESDEVNDDELETLRDGLGAQIRLLQLKGRIEIQVEVGNFIIDTIEENNKTQEFNMSTIEGIVADFESLIQRIEEMNFNQSSDILAQEYVAIKAESIQLTKDFKKEVRGDFIESIREKLQETIKEKRKELLEEKKTSLKELQNKYTKEKLGNLFGNLGFNNAKVKEQLDKGEFDIENIKKFIREELKEMSSQDRKEALLKVKEDEQKIKIQTKEKKEELLERVKEKREEIKEDAKLDRENMLERVKEKREELKEKSEERKEELKERAEEKREEFKNRNNDIQGDNK